MWYVTGQARIHQDMNMRRCWTAWLYLAVCTCVVTFGLATYAGTAVAQSHDSQLGSQQTLQEVTVTARRLQDHRTLARAVSGFVASHSAPGTRINQIGRWYAQVCPETVGLQPAYNEYISHRIVEVARSVGAPTQRGGKCTGNVKIIFSPRPQAQLDYIATKYRPYLGYSGHPSELVKFNHAIESWYITGTRSSVEMHAPGPSCIKYNTCGPPPSANGLGIDSDDWVMGQAGSYLGSEMRIEFVQVTVIADANALVRFPAQTVGDYIAMLVLTRTALDGCNQLPSIIDVLSPDCGDRAKPQGITEADAAYLKALYSSDLENNLNLERGAIHDQMMRQIEER
jgi:hypothetical protein